MRSGEKCHMAAIETHFSHGLKENAPTIERLLVEPICTTPPFRRHTRRTTLAKIRDREKRANQTKGPRDLALLKYVDSGIVGPAEAVMQMVVR